VGYKSSNTWRRRCPRCPCRKRSRYVFGWSNLGERSGDQALEGLPLRKEGARRLSGYNSLLLDFAVYYLRLFQAVVAVVTVCWLVNHSICTGGLSEDGYDVRPQGGKARLSQKSWRHV
jgi:hypothetical protein